jgi:hypothetical protein
MSLDDLKQSLAGSTPPAGLAPAVEALWHDARGDWDRAHRVAQDVPDEAGGAWVHAYLHRKEGDPDNAAYWYRRARQPIAHDTLDQEWDRIATALLARV